MYTKSSLKNCCKKILEENGGHIADEASNILLEDPNLKDLRAPLEFISKTWRDPLTPAMMGLACRAVGGQPEATHEAALAMSLMNLSGYIWDDIIDEALFKTFKPTLFGKFGEGTALIVGGLASAKAFTIFNQMELDKTKRQSITKTFWTFWTNMAKVETINLQLRKKKNFSSKKKLWKIKMEAIDLETCLKIGAILGNGSDDEIKNLSKYGKYLGIIMGLWNDFYVSINLTLELAEKIRCDALPYSLLWAMNRSMEVKKRIENLNKTAIEPSEIKEIVEYSLQTGIMNNTLIGIKRLTGKAVEALKVNDKNKATETLKFFVEAQPPLFMEDISMLYARVD